MSRYIDAEEIIEYCKRQRMGKLSKTIAPCSWYDAYGEFIDILAETLTAGVEEVVRCKDCIYWKDRHILQNDGVERQYCESDGEYVNASVGINVGSMCCCEEGNGYIEDKRVFRNKDDFCSRGRKRTTSYEKCWGIVDGFYPSDCGAKMDKEKEE